VKKCAGLIFDYDDFVSMKCDAGELRDGGATTFGFMAFWAKRAPDFLSFSEAPRQRATMKLVPWLMPRSSMS